MSGVVDLSCNTFPVFLNHWHRIPATHYLVIPSSSVPHNFEAVLRQSRTTLPLPSALTY